MRTLIFIILTALLALPTRAQDAESKINDLLDAFHQAASDADFEAYFGLQTEDAVFIGTDDWERWPRAEFEPYVQDRFENGGGWTYVPLERHIRISDDGRVAWFDELLRNERYGVTRGTGVLVPEGEMDEVGGGWRIALYSLSFTIPNEVTRSVAAQSESIRQFVAADARLEAVADSIAGAYLDSTWVAGISVGVQRGDEMLLLKNYGHADLEYEIPTPPHAVYRIGSITKQFTAAGILRLVEREQIDLNADVTEYLPEFNSQGRSVPVARLLDHTSGIQGYTEMPAFWQLSSQELPRDSLVALMGSWPFWHEPGEQMIYNNSAYFLLGLIIEKVAETSYEQFLQDEFFGPLGMQDSRYCSNSEVVPRRMRGYSYGPGGLHRADYLSHIWPYAAGSICSSVEDLLAWNAALHGGLVLGKEAYARMISPQPLESGALIRYAAGLGVAPMNGRPALAHGGGINGFLSDAVHFPDEEVTIVVLTSTTGPGSPAALTHSLADAMFGPSPEPLARELDMDLGPYLGEWTGVDRGGPSTFMLTESEGTLVIGRGNQDAYPLRYVGDGWFVFPMGGFRVGLTVGSRGTQQVEIDYGSGYTVLRK